MREGWQETTLGEVLEPVSKRAGVVNLELVLSVTEKRGIIPQTEVFKNRIATEDVSKYKVLQPLDIAFNPYLLWCGAIGQWLGHEPGVVSPVYECFRASTAIDARYAGLIFESSVLTPYFNATAIGSIERRRRTTVPVFSRAQILLPPLTEQKRIVDVIGAVDAYVAALESYATAARTARAALLHELLTTNTKGWKETTLGEVLDRSIGGVWGSEVGTDEKDVTVVRSTEFAPSGNLGFSTGVSRSITAKQLQSRELRDGDILLEKSGGGPQQPVGRVVFVDATIPQFFVCSNFVQLLTPQRRKAEPRFIFLMLWLWHFEGRTLEFQAHTTGIRNLRTQDYLGQAILLPPLTEQKRIVDVIGSVDGAIAGADRAAEDARNLRSGLLSDLLSGDHGIPESYDELLAAA